MINWTLTWALAATVTALWYGLSYRRERGRVAFWRSRSREWCDRYYHDTGSAEGALQELEAMLRAYGLDPEAPMPREVEARYRAEIAKTTPPQMSAPTGGA